MCCHQLFCKNCMTKEWYKTFCLGHVCCHQFFCKNCMTTAWCKSFCWGQMCCHPLFCKNCKAKGCCKAIHIAHMQAGCTHGADMLCAVPRYQIQSCQKDNFRFMGCQRCQLDSFGRSRWRSVFRTLMTLRSEHFFSTASSNIVHTCSGSTRTRLVADLVEFLDCED